MSSISVHKMASLYSPAAGMHRNKADALFAQNADLTLCEAEGFRIISAGSSTFYWPGYGRVGSWWCLYKNGPLSGGFVLRYPLHRFADDQRQAKFMASVRKRNAKIMAKFGIIADPDARKALDLCP